MRRLCLISLTLLAVSMTPPLRAQVAAQNGIMLDHRASADAVVTRLMTFDLNHDGVISRSELPERLQPLFDRDDVSDRDGLEPVDIRRLAANPQPDAATRGGLQIGHYGFGDGSSFDTRLHIEGALDDLRLAGDTREKAFGVAHDFEATSDARASARLLSSMERVLTAAQFRDFKSSFDGQVVTVPALKQGNVLFFGATPQEAAAQPRVMTRIRVASGFNPLQKVESYALAGAAKRHALGAIDEYQSSKRGGPLSGSERVVLLVRLGGVLDEQQLDDLRAALERRPIVKQATAVAIVRSFNNQLFRLDDRLAAPLPIGETLTVQDLVLKNR